VWNKPTYYRTTPRIKRYFLRATSYINTVCLIGLELAAWGKIASNFISTPSLKRDRKFFQFSAFSCLLASILGVVCGQIHFPRTRQEFLFSEEETFRIFDSATYTWIIDRKKNVREWFGVDMVQFAAFLKESERSLLFACSGQPQTSSADEDTKTATRLRREATRDLP
jgi:hypothetical protein